MEIKWAKPILFFKRDYLAMHIHFLYGVAQITEENKPPFDNLYAPTLASA